MSYAVWVKQSGQGCDYTIACGQKLINLKATTVEDAVEEAKKTLVDDYGFEVGGDRDPEKILIVEIVHEIASDELPNEDDDEEEDDFATRQRRLQYEALKKEFG
jgi:hypothetical protein